MPQVQPGQGNTTLYSFRSLAYKGFPGGYSIRVRVCPLLTQKLRIYEVVSANDA